MNDAIEVTRLALNMAQLEQQNLAQRIAQFKTGVQTVQEYDFSLLLTQLQQVDNEQRGAIAQQTLDLERHLNVINEEPQLDDLVARSSMVTGQYNVLVEGLNRQLGLMSLVINGGKR